MECQALMDKSDWSASAPLFSRLEVLETLDAQSRVLKGNVLPSGAANAVSMSHTMGTCKGRACNGLTCNDYNLHYGPGSNSTHHQ